MSKLFIERDTLTAIADAIREKGGFEANLSPLDMPTEIANLPSGGGELPEEALVITGDCKYRFAANGWNWFIDTYGSQITTENISDISNMFLDSTNLTSIPFEINTYLKSTIYTHNMTSVFSNCQNLLALPNVNNARPSQIDSLFKNCYRLREVPASFYESWTWDSAKNASQLFNGCYSLRKAPIDMLAQLENYPYSSDYYYSYIYQGFYYCVVLDELINLPIPSCYISPNITSNMFYNFVTRCQRLKNLTFALQEDGTPYVVKWKSQTIDLTNYVGYAFDTTAILNYNSGITSDKLVKNADTYAALKDDEDWYSNLASYSRYNHDSAVATINSLPDTSAYLASAGGTNTIKFKGTCGSATDGGAINTLTEEEIAVATAKGWTVSLV